jgi:tetratricopeptide (TPR) repeat protein
MLVILGTNGDWVSRDSLALVFWPDAPRTEALHHVRINLHRAKTLLASWGQEGALNAERSRVRLSLPTDIAPLGRSAEDRDIGRDPSSWLQGWRLPGYESFSEWCDETLQDLHGAWLKRARHAQQAALRTPAGIGAPASPPGRKNELGDLVASAAAAFVLHGEPGAGKTTLLQAAFPDAISIKGLDGLQALPYQPLLEALRSRTETLERLLRNPNHPLRCYRLDLARVMPELAPDEPLPPLDVATAKARLIEALTRAFEALSPIVLVDDLQWCDTATVEWLVTLAHGNRLRWRAAARKHEMPGAHAQALAVLRTTRRLQESDLRPLTRDALAEVCRMRWPDQDFSASRLDHLHVISAGNAFLLNELIALGPDIKEETDDTPLRKRISGLVMARLRALPAGAQQVIESAAVFVHPVLPQALGSADAADSAAEVEPEIDHLSIALASSLLHACDGKISCRHDLIRETVVESLSERRASELHRRAALWLAGRDDSDALTVAEHWRAGGELQTALAWRHRGAERLKSRGDFNQARLLWRQVADESTDVAQSLRAQLELAACDLYHDLRRGEQTLTSVHAQLVAVADPDQHRLLEARALAALVDNRVFAGDIASASSHAARLRQLLPELPSRERCDALEVLIELAMRQPDIPAAWACLAQLRVVSPRLPTLLSFEGQIHWFGGQVQAAHDALARLLERHPEFCRGITIENDLAVFLQALGRIEEAETMARRSLRSWKGVAHTETLSLLVLGLVLTSAGRHREAEAALLQAEQLAREQASPGFEAEALVRRSRLLLQCGRVEHARELLETAAPMLASSDEPLRVSQLVLAQVQASCEADPSIAAAMARLRDVCTRSAHPLVHAREARAACEISMRAGDWSQAAFAADRLVELSKSAGLLEPLSDGLLLQAKTADNSSAALRRVEQALGIARKQGFADVIWRASTWLAERNPTAENVRLAQEALLRMRGAESDPLFDETGATRREPCWH